MNDQIKEPKKAPSLREYAKQHEEQAAKKGLVVTHISHPSADGTVHQGRHAGIRTSKGEMRATYSDGSKH